jgi:hypothetical protein
MQKLVPWLMYRFLIRIGLLKANPCLYRFLIRIGLHRFLIRIELLKANPCFGLYKNCIIS